MTVASYVAPNNTTQDPATYKAAIDGGMSVFTRLAQSFAPHAQTSPAMTVRLDAGHVFNGVTLTEVAAQSTGTITAPVSNPRIDRVVIDTLTGAVSVITGTPAGSPVAPTLTAGTAPIAQVLLQTTSAVITNSMITDERDLSFLGRLAGAQGSIASATTTSIAAAKLSNFILTGNATITSFGTSGTTGTIYKFRLTGTPTFTNSSSLICPGGANIAGRVGDTGEIEDLGSNNWMIREYFDGDGTPLTGGSGILGAFRKLKIVTTGLTNFSSVITADEVVLENASFGYFTARAVNVTGTINGSVGVANSLDTGTLAASTWYYLWIIYNGTTVASLFSASATAPTLPSGYTYKARVGAVRTDASVNKYLLQTIQIGRRVQYSVLSSSNTASLPVITSGAQGTVSAGTVTAYQTASLANFVPPSAGAISVILSIANGGYATVASSPDTPATYAGTSNTISINPSGFNGALQGIYLLESANLYYASTSGASLGCLGWEENL